MAYNLGNLPIFCGKFIPLIYPDFPPFSDLYPMMLLWLHDVIPLLAETTQLINIQ